MNADFRALRDTAKLSRMPVGSIESNETIFVREWRVVELHAKRDVVARGLNEAARTDRAAETRDLRRGFRLGTRAHRYWQGQNSQGIGDRSRAFHLNWQAPGCSMRWDEDVSRAHRLHRRRNANGPHQTWPRRVVNHDHSHSSSERCAGRCEPSGPLLIRARSRLDPG